MNEIDIADQPPERRVKAYRISEDDILFFLRLYDNWPEYLSVSTGIQGPPLGCRIEYIYPCLASRCMWAVVSHPDFDIVPDGEYTPKADDPLRVEYSLLARGEDGVYRLPGPNSGERQVDHPQIELRWLDLVPYVVIRSRIEKDDEQKACESLMRESLGAVRHQHIRRQGDSMVAALPLTKDFFANLLNSGLVGFYYNDGPICPTCHRANDTTPFTRAQIIHSLATIASKELVASELRSLRDKINERLYDLDNQRNT